jgi:hypothetical protein
MGSTSSHSFAFVQLLPDLYRVDVALLTGNRLQGIALIRTSEGVDPEISIVKFLPIKIAAEIIEEWKRPQTRLERDGGRTFGFTPMRSHHLAEIVGTGIRPYMEIMPMVVITTMGDKENQLVKDSILFPGQRGEILEMTRADSDRWRITVDLAQFAEHNQGVAAITGESFAPPINHLQQLWVGTFIHEFRLVECSRLLHEWMVLAQPQESYTAYIERRLKQVQMELEGRALLAN